MVTFIIDIYIYMNCFSVVDFTAKMWRHCVELNLGRRLVA